MRNFKICLFGVLIGQICGVCPEAGSIKFKSVLGKIFGKLKKDGKYISTHKCLPTMVGFW